MWYCPKCGASNSNNYSFCGNCGCGRVEKKAGVSKTALLGIAAAVIILALGIWVIRLTQQAKSVSVGTAAPSYTASSSSAHTHNWGGWITEKQPSCTTPGVEVRTCIDDANHQERREIPALGHDWLPATFTQPKICSRCGTSSGAPAPESTFPTVEEIKTLFRTTTHRAESNTGVALTLPNDSSYLTSPYRAKVNASSSSGRIYIMPKPKAGNGNLGTIDDGTEVVIVAKQSGFVFFISYDGRMGWNGEKYFKVR